MKYLKVLNEIPSAAEVDAMEEDYPVFLLKEDGSDETITKCDWNTSKVTTMYGMFNQCFELESVDVSNWDTSNVTDMCNMFFGVVKPILQLGQKYHVH